ncbi:hypothetical protein HN51_048530, partial [Arachis hypogaea]
DGITYAGANTSSAQRRARAPPLPHSRNSGRQSRVNAVPFRPPRNKRWLASSSDMSDTRAPAMRTESWDHMKMQMSIQKMKTMTQRRMRSSLLMIMSTTCLPRTKLNI